MYMKERFGAWQIGNDEKKGKVKFKLFFPDRKKDPTQYLAQPREGGQVERYGEPRLAKVQVIGDFQHCLGQADWDRDTAPEMEKQDHPKGWVYTYQTDLELLANFYEYKYFVTFENGERRIVSDPCTRYGGSENQNSALAVGGSDPAVQPLPKRKHLRDLIIYELMIDDFTDEYRGDRAPLDAVRDKLKYLANDLGINAILFMPWTAWPGERFSWGYTPYQYFSVEYRYANAFDKPAEKLSWLIHLINECHQLGLHVIMDGVFNHVGDAPVTGVSAPGFPYRWLYQDPKACPYVGKFGGQFPGLTDLDFWNGCTREYIRDVCLYWIDDFKIDGIRFDNTPNFYAQDTSEGLKGLLADINKHLADNGDTNFSLTLEHLDGNAAGVAKATGATSYWNDELTWRTREYLYNWKLDSRIMKALDNHCGLDPEQVATTYLSNHDHSHVTWYAGAGEDKGGLRWFRTQPYAIVLLTSPGVPMIQNGQEFAEDHWIVENDEGSDRRVKPRPLRWDFVNDPVGSRLLHLYKKLTEIRKSHPSLSSNNFYPAGWEEWMTQFNPQGYGVDAGRQVVIYHRWGEAEDGGLERFMIVLNFSGQDQHVDVPFAANGDWRDLLNDRTETVTDYRLRDQRINSNWGRVYYQKT